MVKRLIRRPAEENLTEGGDDEFEDGDDDEEDESGKDADQEPENADPPPAAQVSVTNLFNFEEEF